MPRCNGKDFIQQFRQIPGFVNTPIYFTSGSGRHDIKKIANESGAQGYLEKPVDLDTLVSTVKAILV